MVKHHPTKKNSMASRIMICTIFSNVKFVFVIRGLLDSTISLGKWLDLAQAYS